MQEPQDQMKIPLPKIREGAVMLPGRLSNNSSAAMWLDWLLLVISSPDHFPYKPGRNSFSTFSSILFFFLNIIDFANLNIIS